MKKSILTLLVLLVCTFYTATAYEYFTIYFSDGTKSEAFYATDVDSICYSKLSLDGITYDDWQVQEIYTCDSVYRYPLAQIDSLSFKDVDENKVIKDIAHVSSGVSPIYAHCESIQEIVQHLSEIKSIDGVEDAWTDSQTLFVKIKDWGTLTYLYISEDEPFDNVFAQEAPSQIMRRTKSANSSSSHQDYTEEIRNICVFNQEYRDKGRDDRRKAEKAFIDLCEMWGFNVKPIYEPSPKFFIDDIYDYDFVFMITHGSYDEKTGLHWLLTGEELYVGDKDGLVDEKIMEAKARDQFWKNYSKIKDEDKERAANYLSIGSCKEIRGGAKVHVYYTSISNKLIAYGNKKFNHPGKAIVFNSACKSLMGYDEKHDNDNLAKAFFKKGAGLYLGYNQISRTGHVAGNSLLMGLLNGKSSYASFLSIPKMYSDYTFYSEDEGKEVHTILRYKLNPAYKYDICLTHPETYDSKSSTESSNYKLEGGMRSYNPICEFYSTNSCNDEVLKNTYGFYYSNNPDMINAEKIDVNLYSSDISYDDQNCFLTWEATLNDKDLKPNTTYYYRAYMNDGYSDCYGEIKQFTTKGGDEEAYVVLKDGVVTFYYDAEQKQKEGKVYKLPQEYSVSPGWSGGCSKVIFDPSFANYRPTSTAKWFYGCSKLKTIENIQYLNTANVTSMYEMFSLCSSLTSLDLSSFNTANVTNMSKMFNWCSSLTTLDLSSFNTEKATSMYEMFYECGSLTSLDLSSFNTANVKNMSEMFSGCESLTSLDLSSFNTEKATSMYEMFYCCESLTSLDLSSFNTANVKNMSEMFCRCKSLTSLDLSSFNTANVTSMYEMFSLCSSLTTLDFRNLVLTGKNGAELFADLRNLQYLNLGNANTEKATSMYEMFSECSSLTSLDLSSFNTANVTNMSSMFFDCHSLTSLDVSSFNTANVTNMSSMFRWCESLTSLDLSSFNTANVTNMRDMFKYCSSLTSLDFRNLTLTEGTGVDLFANLKNLQDLNLSNANTGKATSMKNMFSGCKCLTTLDLSSFNTANVTNMWCMFFDCSSLTSLDLSSFNTDNVTNMDEMFRGCSSLTSLDLSSFNTSNVTNMSSMFYECGSLTSLDLSSFNTANVKTMSEMFYKCSSLITIYAGNWNSSYTIPSVFMFTGCDNLVGGKGTKIGENLLGGYDEYGFPLRYSCPTDESAAHIDGGKDNPGLFTAK